MNILNRPISVAIAFLTAMMCLNLLFPIKWYQMYGQTITVILLIILAVITKGIVKADLNGQTQDGSSPESGQANNCGSAPAAGKTGRVGRSGQSSNQSIERR